VKDSGSLMNGTETDQFKKVHGIRLCINLRGYRLDLRFSLSALLRALRLALGESTVANVVLH
jgi:hypothetical protein